MIQRDEVLREHFKECLEHFSRKVNAKIPPGKKGAATLRKPMADFLGVGDGAVQALLSGRSGVPKGGQLIKLMCYLDLHGYRIIEFERLQRVVRNFMELIGFGILSVDEGARAIGFNDPQGMHRVFKRGRAEPGKEEAMYKVWKEHRSALEHAKEKAYELYRLDLSTARKFGAITVPASGRMAVILPLMQALLGMLEEESLDSLTEEDLEMLQPGNTTVLRLSSHLSKLSLKLAGEGESHGG
jgi:hypothetical protein